MKIKTRNVASETRGDDPKTSGGRRNIAIARVFSKDGGVLMQEKKPEPETCKEGAKDKEGKTKAKDNWGSLEEKKRSRSKRTGYDHPAARPAADDMFSMPDGGISNSAAKNLRKRVDPFLHNSSAAGLDSQKSQAAAVHGILPENPSTKKSGYFPVGKRNPINHQVHKGTEQWDEAQTMGAAGVDSGRLTQITATCVGIGEEKEKKEKGEKALGTQASSFNLSHAAHKPDKVHVGKRRFHDVECHKDTVTFGHRSGPPVPMSQKENKYWSTRKQVQIRGGQYRYNVAGHEDMLPAATAKYTKADRPPSRWHRRENDKRHLPAFYTRNPEDCRVKHAVSEDLVYIMGRAKDAPQKLQDQKKYFDWGEPGEWYSPPFRPDGTTAMDDGVIEVSTPPMQRSRSARVMPTSSLQDTGRTRTPPPKGSTRRSMTPPPSTGRRTPPRGTTPARGYSTRSARSLTPPPSDGGRPRSYQSMSGSMYSIDMEPSPMRDAWMTSGGSEMRDLDAFPPGPPIY